MTKQHRHECVIAYIDQLFEDYQWIKAHQTIERLIDADIENESAQAMRHKLRQAMRFRKKELLGQWKQALSRREIDKSLAILRELDNYLTPKEGLSLQNTVKRLFEKKLDELASEFSKAVSYKQWLRALQVGHQVMHEFPNSRMARQIEEKIDVLRQKVANSA